MADSVRKQIVDAFVTALTTGSTGMVTITTQKKPWWKWDITAFPAVVILEGPEKKRRFAYIGTTAQGDMYSELEVNIIGYAEDMNNDLGTKRTDLIRDIENGIEASTTLNDLTLDVIPQEVITDQGLLDNYAIVHCKYLAKYIYNHGGP